VASIGEPVATAKDGQGERLFTASQWQLMRWRFLKHRAAVVSLFVLGFFYILALFGEFIAPNDPAKHSGALLLAPPQRIHLFDENGLRPPFVYGYEGSRDPVTMRKVFTEDKSVEYPIKLLVHRDRYKFWGIWRTDLHLFGPEDPNAAFLLLGADELGRGALSRLIYGARISLSIGLVGVLISLGLGILIGGISGYFGGVTDLIIQRLIELLNAIPGIPLWLTLSASLPREWSALQVYFGITVILSIRGWTGLARTVRGRFLSLREEDFVMAAKICGSGEMRIILRHMVPSFTSHLIAVLTLAIPGMILSETSLSFLGLGLRDPVISWGVLLSQAQNIRTLALAPWLLLPGVAIIVVVLAFNFVGDGLRDAADPYA
jgi:peptide/nickel transport system permease protein